MRFRDFPLAIDVAGTVYEPALLASFDDVTQVWALVDGKPAVVATGVAVESRDRTGAGTTMSNGARARWAATLVDGTVWPVGHSPECCGCHKHPLCSFVPPEPASVTDEAMA